MTGAPDFDLDADAYRRRIRVRTTEPGVVVSELEDDFHHFVVTLRHDGEHVLSCENTSHRWPWSTCPDAAEPLRKLAGMPLSRRFTAAGKWTDPKQNCTHQFDTACHAITHAACGSRIARLRRRDPAPRSRRPARRDVRLWVDGEPRLAWSIDWNGIVDPPPPFDAAPWRGGFMRWADATLPEDDAECAIVLRRACDIGMGRGMDLDAVPVADQLPQTMARHLPHDAARRRARRVPPRRLDPRFRPRPGSAADRLSAMALQVIAMGGYEIAGPFGPPSELERYLFEAAGVAEAPRVLPRDRVGRRARLHRALLRGLRDAAVRADAPRAVPRPRRRGHRRVPRRVRRRVRRAAGTPRACSACGARTGSTARSPSAARARDFVVGGASAGGMCWFDAGLHDVVRTARPAARRPRLVPRQLLPARAAAGPARRVRGVASATGRCRRAGRSTTAPRCTSSTAELVARRSRRPTARGSTPSTTTARTAHDGERI